MTRCSKSRRFLSADQFLLTTLIVKLAVMAVLATMLARYRRFRHILIFERRGWIDRLVFTLAIGLPLMAGVAVAAAPQLQRRRPDARGRVPRRADRRPVHRRARRPAGRRARRCSPASSSPCRSPSAAGSPAAACARCARRKRSGSSRRSSSWTCRKHVWQMRAEARAELAARAARSRPSRSSCSARRSAPASARTGSSTSIRRRRG